MAATYNELLNTMKSDRGDVYTSLMGKEAKTLETVNKIVNHEANKKAFYAAFFNMPMSAIFADFAGSLSTFVSDMSVARTTGDMAAVFKKNKTVFYVGVTAVALAVLIFLLE